MILKFVKRFVIMTTTRAFTKVRIILNDSIFYNRTKEKGYRGGKNTVLTFSVSVAGTFDDFSGKQKNPCRDPYKYL